MIRLLEKYGISDVPRTEEHEKGPDIKGLLNHYSKHMLEEMAFSLNTIDDKQLIRNMNKSKLVDFLNTEFDTAQTKSKEFIYEQVVQRSKGPDQVQEHAEKPGTQEVSK